MFSKDVYTACRSSLENETCNSELSVISSFQIQRTWISLLRNSITGDGFLVFRLTHRELDLVFAVAETAISEDGLLTFPLTLLMEHNSTIKTYMAIMAERDSAIREKNMALDERRRAFAERDMVMLQRDAAIAERNSAVEERDKALSALQFQESSMNENHISPDSPGNGKTCGAKPLYYHQQMHPIPQPVETGYDPREIPRSNPFQSTGVAYETEKLPRKAKQAEQTKGSSTKKPSRSPRKGKRVSEDLSHGWKSEQDLDDNNEDLDGELGLWKDDDLGLNQIHFDESTMPAPVCSCTGLPQPCYKWGNGGWQSACCTTAMSVYPLPQMSDKRYAQVGGRKMSGSAFAKLFHRFTVEGHDLSTPLDLKDHWPKHGTNCYSTVK
ncbi:protein BASIC PENTACYSTEINE6-like isoform X3 [Actinidia eriantha]|uniref:protein BASIC PENTACYSTEINE6-like isoform X3 n=1 Tax=Actinidia eriantha TaxID=165200 RepID=UPI00258BC2FC|nr:protein BASIC PENTACYSTEINE6-like isoform X3 [Actinidia eriantha]XP_057492497.1 protein BASIC PENTACYSTEINE6-like isoform X3 [Actinidia eriantha]XP_057492498.1 protein BASIC PENTACYSTEINE6-like isoform X3 [Actinidia eriantha]